MAVPSSIFGAPLLALASTDPVAAAIESRGMVLATLIVLVLMSALSWFIIGARAWALLTLRRNLASFWAEYRKHDDLKEAVSALKGHIALPHFRLLTTVIKEVAEDPEGEEEPDLDNIERALRQASEPLVSELERGLGTLGTIASSAPFIGLFGTVWGIMMAFGNLSDTGSVLQTVAPHIAQALVATAVGLLAAIPAVIGYNGLGRVVRDVVTDLDGFGLELLNQVNRRSRMLLHEDDQVDVR
jgi:biopolymer transport protein TolQ